MSNFFFEYLLSEIDKYKNNKKINYSKIALEIGIKPYVFANMRNDWKNRKGYPRKETITKLQKIIKI